MGYLTEFGLSLKPGMDGQSSTQTEFQKYVLDNAF